MQLRLLRHATLVVTLNNSTLLVDPMLSPAEAMPPIANASNDRRIPMVDLPITDEELRDLLQHIDGVLVTHTHRDHWDARAVELLPKSLPILCQPASEAAIREAGFTAVSPIADTLNWRGIDIHRTGGQHGTGEIGKAMGIVSGFVLKAAGEPSLYIAGDTIWCDEVQQALDTYAPDNVVVNAGAAQFLTGDPITMTAEDVIKVCHALPSARVIADHMETVNHCWLTRPMLREKITQADVSVTIPDDGETLSFDS